MKSNLKVFLLALSLVVTAVNNEALSQIKSGPVIGVSRTTLSFTENRAVKIPQDPNIYQISSKAGFSGFVGYKFQFQLNEKVSLDASLLFNLRSLAINTPYEPANSEPNKVYLWDEEKITTALSGQVLANYHIYKGLKIGVGLEPTYVLTNKYKYNAQSPILDMPILGQLAYDFGPYEIALGYKHGIASVYKNNFTKNAKTRDIQISLFIPVFR